MPGLKSARRSSNYARPKRELSINAKLDMGRWMLPSDQMFFIFEPYDAEVTVFVNETNMRLVSVGQAAKFIPNDGVSGVHYARVSDLRLQLRKPLLMAK